MYHTNIYPHHCQTATFKIMMRVYIGHAPAEQCGLKEYLHGWGMCRLKDQEHIKSEQTHCKWKAKIQHTEKL